MGGWAETCAHCRDRELGKMKNGREAHYCVDHEKFMIGRFPPGLDWTRQVCFKPEEEEVEWFGGG